MPYKKAEGRWSEFPRMTRAWRRRLGLTRRDAAERLGVPRRTLEGWEYGRIPAYPQPMVLAMSYIEWANDQRDPKGGGQKEASTPPRL